MILVKADRFMNAIGYKALAIWPFIFFKGDMTIKVLRHESIHHRQQKELLIIPFFVLYLVFYLYYRLQYNHHGAYRAIPFEREAYLGEKIKFYLKHRKLYTWVDFL